MRRKILICVSTVVIFAIVAPLCVSAAVPSDAELLQTGVYYINSTTWSNPDNTAVSGNVNTYYQWFFTCIPAYNNSTYKPPNFAYTYDGSFLAGSSPTMVYQIKVRSEYMSDYGGQVMIVEYIKTDADGNQSFVTLNSYYPGIQYRELVVFCGWGMDSSGNLKYLIDIDQTLVIVTLASSPNGDTHLYAKPNSFSDFYIMGCTTMQASSTDANIKSYYQTMEDMAADTDTYMDWLYYVYSGDTSGSGSGSGSDEDLDKTVNDIYNLLAESHWNEVQGDPAPNMGTIQTPDYSGVTDLDNMFTQVYDEALLVNTLNDGFAASVYWDGMAYVVTLLQSYVTGAVWLVPVFACILFFVLAGFLSGRTFQNTVAFSRRVNSKSDSHSDSDDGGGK